MTVEMGGDDIHDKLYGLILADIICAEKCEYYSQNVENNRTIRHNVYIILNKNQKRLFIDNF